MFFCSKNYPRAVVLFGSQAHELFIFFSKGIDISKFYNIDISCACKASNERNMFDCILASKLPSKKKKKLLFY